MKIVRLDHVNVRTSRLREMVAWYETYLGLTSGPRPAFGMGGAWLYAGEDPVVHLVEVDRPGASVEPNIEHFAFAATGRAAFLRRLEAGGVAARVSRVPGMPIVQVNVADCDGNHIHVDFAADEDADTDEAETARPGA